MKTIGLIGGMSWESTVTYYKVINETVSRELGGLHSAEIILHSVDFDVIEKFQSRGEWDKCAEVMSDSAVRLEKAGADFIVDELCIGKVKSKSREVLLRIIKKLEAKGAEGIILGCTELGLIVGEEDTSLPLFDTSLIHAEKAALLALGKE